MIIFHEGMPRSGKSYEAIVKQVLMYLTSGRQCFCFVAGLDFEKFAEITGIELEKLRGRVVLTPISVNEQSDHKYTRQDGNKFYSVEYQGLLFQIEDDQVLKIYNHVANDSFVVIDELQDNFPVGTKPLEMGIRQFVTKHGHRGIDILCMGQAVEDCHTLWKRRIDQKITFEKRDAIGQPESYTWRSYKQQKKGDRFKFVLIRSGKGTYDKKYFGLYKSHAAGVNNKGNHTDDRVNIFKSKSFLFYLPVFLIVIGFAVNHMINFFNGDLNKEVKPLALKPDRKQSLSLQPVSTNLKLSDNTNKLKIEALKKEKEELEALIEETKQKEYSHELYVQTIAKKYKPRLSGIIEDDEKLVAYIQFLDDTFHVHEELNLVQLKDLGWSYERKSYGIKLIHDDVTLVVTAWPIDSIGKVSNHTLDQL